MALAQCGSCQKRKPLGGEGSVSEPLPPRPRLSIHPHVHLALVMNGVQAPLHGSPHVCG